MQNKNQHLCNFPCVLRQRARAMARIKGSPEYPALTGTVQFHQTFLGVLVSVQIAGLPMESRACDSPFFAFHIHSGSTCTGNEADAFADVKTHYNPEGCAHSGHAGDLPPLLGNQGTAYQVFLTDRFSVDEIVGKTVVIHRNRDDFTTQPSGDAGTKIGCGEIVRPSYRSKAGGPARNFWGRHTM